MVCRRHAILHSAGRDLTEGLTRSSPSKGTLALPPQRGRLLVVSKRNRATLERITTQCSNRRRKSTKRKPVISQTETSSLLAPNVSVTVKKASGIDDTSFRCLMSLTPTSARICTPCRALRWHDLFIMKGDFHLRKNFVHYTASKVFARWWNITMLSWFPSVR